MSRFALILFLFCFPVAGRGQFAAVELHADAEKKQAGVEDQVELEPAAEDDQVAVERVIASKIDKKKFNEARERREKRRDAALAERGRRNANRTHVYALQRVIPVPLYSRPFTAPTIPIPVAAGGNGGGAIGVVNIPRSVLLGRVAFPGATILYLHDQDEDADDVKRTALIGSNFRVLRPELPELDFGESVAIAQQALDDVDPDLIVGVGRGAAVAMALRSGDTKQILLAPTWKRDGLATIAKPETVVMHAPTDNVVPIADSQELISNSELPSEAFVRVGKDHRLDDIPALQTLVLISRLLTQ